MRIVFADAGFWIAMIDPQDKRSRIANTMANKYKSAEIVTTEFLIAESLNAFSARGEYWRVRALEFMRTAVLSSKRVSVLRPTAQLFRQALALYGSRGDKDWGLTDCISFVIMRDLVISDALAHDHHFVQAGFRALLRDET